MEVNKGRRWCPALCGAMALQEQDEAEDGDDGDEDEDVAEKGMMERGLGS